MSAKTPPPQLSSAELGVLKALWHLGPSPVADVRRHLGEVSAYTTIMTLLSRLAQKGAVAVDRRREPFLYTAVVTRNQIQGARVRELVSTVFDGSARSLIMGLVSAEGVSPEELEELAARIRQAKAEASPDEAAAAPDQPLPSSPELQEGQAKP